MRRDPSDYQAREMELVYIARRVSEAQKIEALLDQQGIDYVIEVEQFRAGVIFASVRAGAFFYVLPQDAERSRDALRHSGYKPQEPLS